MDLLTSDAARILGVSPDLVRHLERTGRLRARRTLSGVRLFDLDAVEQLRLVREARARV